jgi:hypothetical protein
MNFDDASDDTVTEIVKLRLRALRVLCGNLLGLKSQSGELKNNVDASNQVSGIDPRYPLSQPMQPSIGWRHRQRLFVQNPGTSLLLLPRSFHEESNLGHKPNAHIIPSGMAVSNQSPTPEKGKLPKEKNKGILLLFNEQSQLCTAFY